MAQTNARNENNGCNAKDFVLLRTVVTKNDAVKTIKRIFELSGRGSPIISEIPHILRYLLTNKVNWQFELINILEERRFNTTPELIGNGPSQLVDRTESDVRFRHTAFHAYHELDHRVIRLNSDIKMALFLHHSSF